MKQGRQSILLVQLTSAPVGADALVPALQTDDSYSIENSISDVETKFGRMLAYGTNSETFDITMRGQKGDAGQKAILDAIKNKVQLKIWEVDTEPNAESTYDSLFAYAIVESFERSNPADDSQEVSATIQVIGESQEGTFTTLPEELINFAKYGFELPGQTTGEFGSEDNPTGYVPTETP
ncbi:phage major tail protein, TP901-1 family [Lysinibacillus sp. SGAir0095]|uniref:phage major tail protein, TP901-1 family n=1 Tax=Lysinibacillus sp. SGAir0095 TaxID=2070463 RepID=UPI0010CCE046|nr:phage major tail protein, TP901-1 family [Lysinibacillus sp. SGAir0095]QCR33125.1 phage major tail protein, TP901-1 family [Lysinibacillus sp. SGAir0095]